MSVHIIYYKDGAKLMRPVANETEYRLARDTEHNRRADKHHMLQMNYSCLPNPDGSLKGTTRMSNSVGMDIDFDPKAPDYEEKMKNVPELVLGKKEELGLLMLERSANKGYHIAFKRRPELSQEDNLKWASGLLGVEYDKGAKDITRVFFTPPTDRLLFVDSQLFENTEANEKNTDSSDSADNKNQINQKNPYSEKHGLNTDSAEPLDSSLFTLHSSLPSGSAEPLDSSLFPLHSSLNYLGIPYSDIIRKWWQMYNDSQEPVRSNRNTLTFELAVNLRHICDFNRDLLNHVIPCYDGFPEAEKLSCIDNALSEKRTQMPKRLKDVLLAIRQERISQNHAEGETIVMGDELDEVLAQDDLYYHNVLPRMPQGVKDSIEAAGPTLAMPAIIAISPVIGALATGVKVEIHGKMSWLNLTSYIAGLFASNKGNIDPIIDEWTYELRATDKIYLQQEDEWRERKRAAKNKKDQPEEPKLPVRCLTLNNTVANLAERLANTGGKHAFSFTPEADTVAQKWRAAMCDFSVMLRQAYDGTCYQREARSAEAVNVHIDHLLWNVVMCGTPDALYRVVSNYTDGFQSRIAVARTPDNTFTPLKDNLYVLTDKHRERIRQVAHLLPLMQGEVVLAKLEAKGRQWLEQVRLESMKNDDKIMARQRFRICPTTMRIMTCLMLCRVATQLIDKHGMAGAEKHLREQPSLWKEIIVKMQQPAFLAAYDVIADYLMDNALYFFRGRIEAAFNSKDYAGDSMQERSRRGKNDNIFARLDNTFSFEQAVQHAIAVKGADTSRRTVTQMLKNWRKQGLIAYASNHRFEKLQSV